MDSSITSSHADTRRLRRRMLTAAVVALLIFLSAGRLSRPAPAFDDSALETYELEVLPDPTRVAPLLLRPLEPFVMANLLAFKDMATGAGFEDLTGAQAYQIYIEGLTEAQAAIDSRLIWAGAVRTQLVGSSEPVFESIALLQYANPLSFLLFAQNPGEAPEARTAGLLGQWLVASTTVEEPEPAPPSVARHSGGGFGGPLGPCTERLDLASSQPSNVSGLSREKICRLLERPANRPVFIVELLRFADESGELYRPYRQALGAATQERGGHLVWRGSLDSYVLGIASPSFDELVVTGYPDPRAYLRVLADPRVLAASESRADGLELHWIYAADETTDAFGF